MLLSSLLFWPRPRSAGPQAGDMAARLKPL